MFLIIGADVENHVISKNSTIMALVFAGSCHFLEMMLYSRENPLFNSMKKRYCSYIDGVVIFKG